MCVRNVHYGHNQKHFCHVLEQFQHFVLIVKRGRHVYNVKKLPFLYCYERDFMDSLNHDNQADDIEAFNSTSRYLDDLLIIDNPYFEGMVNQIYPPELQLNKANISDTEAPF